MAKSGTTKPTPPNKRVGVPLPDEYGQVQDFAPDPRAAQNKEDGGIYEDSRVIRKREDFDRTAASRAKNRAAAAATKTSQAPQEPAYLEPSALDPLAAKDANGDDLDLGGAKDIPPPPPPRPNRPLEEKAPPPPPRPSRPTQGAAPVGEYIDPRRDLASAPDGIYSDHTLVNEGTLGPAPRTPVYPVRTANFEAPKQSLAEIRAQVAELNAAEAARARAATRPQAPIPQQGGDKGSDIDSGFEEEVTPPPVPPKAPKVADSTPPVVNRANKPNVAPPVPPKASQKQAGGKEADGDSGFEEEAPPPPVVDRTNKPDLAPPVPPKASQKQAVGRFSAAVVAEGDRHSVNRGGRT